MEVHEVFLHEGIYGVRYDGVHGGRAVPGAPEPWKQVQLIVGGQTIDIPVDQLEDVAWHLAAWSRLVARVVALQKESAFADSPELQARALPTAAPGPNLPVTPGDGQMIGMRPVPTGVEGSGAPPYPQHEVSAALLMGGEAIAAADAARLPPGAPPIASAQARYYYDAAGQIQPWPVDGLGQPLPAQG